MSHPNNTTLAPTDEQKPQPQPETTAPDFQALVDMIAPTDDDSTGMVAASSARVYRVTFGKWQTWANDNGLEPLDLSFKNVGQFLADEKTSTKATKQRQLSALRKLAEVLSILDFQNPARKAAYDSLKLLKVRATGESRESERERRALTPAQADRMMRYWRETKPTDRDDYVMVTNSKGKESEVHAVLAKRNRAIVAAALATGLRRAELAALRWQDIDFEAGTLFVAHGKGDKSEPVAIFGDDAIDALKQWQMVQPSGYGFVFVGLRKGGTFTGDAPMNTLSVWRVITATGEAIGLGHVKPHDLRRTLGTEMLNAGYPVHEAQAQLRHSNAQTTLDNYAVHAEARARRKSGKIRYG